MTREKLNAKKRTVVGKKVKLLRKKGLLPANVYGKKVDSLALELEYKDFSKIFKKAGETGLVDLKVEGEEKSRPVLIHALQKHPVSGKILHTDFYQVDLKEKIKALIPVVLENHAPAVSEGKGVLLHVLSEVEVEALPAELPEHFVLSVKGLVDLNQSLFVKDLAYDKNKATILTSPEEVVVKIGAMAKEEEAPKPVVEEVAPEGAVPAEDEAAKPKPTEEKTS